MRIQKHGYDRYITVPCGAIISYDIRIPGRVSVTGDHPDQRFLRFVQRTLYPEMQRVFSEMHVTGDEALWCVAVSLQEAHDLFFARLREEHESR